MFRRWSMLNQFSRTQLLLGKESIERLQDPSWRSPTTAGGRCHRGG